MANLKQNKSEFVDMVFSTLDRKPVTDQEARWNYKSVLLDYVNFLDRLSPLPPTPYFISQRKYVEKLEIYLDRWKSIGSDFLPDNKLESFLTEMQDYMRDWNDDLIRMEQELYYAEKKFYSAIAYDSSYTNVYGNKQDFMNDQQTSLEKLKSKINLPGFKQKYISDE